MFPSHLSRLILVLAVLLSLPALSCKRGGYPGAPEGYDFRTVQVAWKLTGAFHGTSELYIETAGYKDGQLLYKRFAAKNDINLPIRGQQEGTRAHKSWIFNIDGDSYAVIPEIRQVIKNRLNLNQMISLRRTQMWREVIAYVIPRTDLTQNQRDDLKQHIVKITDEDLVKVGAKIENDTFMGHKVKRYEISLAGGKASLWMYGDLPLKEEIRIKRGEMHFEKEMVATKFVLNENLPKDPFTVPKGYKLIDRTKKIEAH